MAKLESKVRVEKKAVVLLDSKRFVEFPLDVSYPKRKISEPYTKGNGSQMSHAEIREKLTPQSKPH